MVRKNRGFTLIELVVTIAIAGILFVAVMSIIPFVTKINSTANDLVQAQNLAQMKLQVIEKQLRYANSLNIDSALPGTQVEELTYLYLNNGRIYMKSYGSEAKAITSDRGFEDYNYNISFLPVNSHVLQVNLAILKNSEQIYRINSKIYINNLLSKSITGVAQGNCVSFQLTGNLVSLITVTSPSSTISVNGQTLQMSASVYPTNATKQGVAWSVENPEYARITQDGLLTPLKNGTVIVKATAVDGSAVFGTKQIIISNQFVTISDLTLTTNTGGETLRRYGYSLIIIPNFTPTDATNKQITWKVDNPNYATIDSNGVLTSKDIRNKSVIVTATTNDGSGIKATIEIRLIG